MFAHPHKRQLNYDYSGLPWFGQQRKKLNRFRKNSSSNNLNRRPGDPHLGNEEDWPAGLTGECELVDYSASFIMQDIR